MPSASVEDYLKTIYHQQQRTSRPVRTNAIADALQIAPSSVTSMLKSLASDGLIDYAPYQGVRLTPQGERQALRTIRNHRLVELFLMRTLGFRWDEVHREAEALEHALSDEVADRIDAFLEYPDTDPHGDPIPRADGSVRPSTGIRLTRLEPDQSATISRVLEQSPAVLRYLAERNLIPGQPIRFLGQEPFNGPVTLDVDGETVTLSHDLASRILTEA